MKNGNSQLDQAEKVIRGFPQGRIFHLRDCLPAPQALWGKWFFQRVDRGAIPGVTFYGKDTQGVNLYQKH